MSSTDIEAGDKEKICTYRPGPGFRRVLSGTAYILNQTTCHLKEDGEFEYFDLRDEGIKLRAQLIWKNGAETIHETDLLMLGESRWGIVDPPPETPPVDSVPNPPTPAPDKSGGLPILVYIVIGIVTLIGLVVIIFCTRRFCKKPSPKPEPKEGSMIESPKSTASGQKWRSAIKLWRSYCIK